MDKLFFRCLLGLIGGMLGLLIACIICGFSFGWNTPISLSPDWGLWLNVFFGIGGVITLFILSNKLFK